MRHHQHQPPTTTHHVTSCHCTCPPQPPPPPMSHNNSLVCFSCPPHPLLTTKTTNKSLWLVGLFFLSSLPHVNYHDHQWVTMSHWWVAPPKPPKPPMSHNRVVHSSHFWAIFGSFLASFLDHFQGLAEKWLQNETKNGYHERSETQTFVKWQQNAFYITLAVLTSARHFQTPPQRTCHMKLILPKSNRYFISLFNLWTEYCGSLYILSYY